MTELERQLAAYTDFLEERSLARSTDHTSPTTEPGDVIVLDLLDAKDDRTAEAQSGPKETNRGRGRTWLLVAAAAAALIVATVGLLNVGDEGAADLDTVDQPEANDTLIDFGAVMAEATATRDNTGLEALFRRDATVSVDGRPFSDGFDAMTTDRWFELMPFTFDCPTTDGDGVVVCRFSSSVVMLDDHDVDWVGEAQLTWADGVVVDAALRSDDATAWGEAFDGYFGWLDAVHPDDFRRMFIPSTGFVETDESAALHARYAAEYNALLGFGQTLTDLTNGGDPDALRSAWSDSLVAVFNGNTVPADAAVGVYTSTAFRGLVDAQYDDCAVVGAVVECRWAWDYGMLDDVDVVDTGSIVFTLDDGVIIEVEQNTDDLDGAIAALSGYRDWVAGSHGDSFATMFSPNGAVAFTAESAELHARYSAEYNATLG